MFFPWPRDSAWPGAWPAQALGCAPRRAPASGLGRRGCCGLDPLSPPRAGGGDRPRQTWCGCARKVRTLLLRASRDTRCVSRRSPEGAFSNFRFQTSCWYRNETTTTFTRTGQLIGAIAFGFDIVFRYFFPEFQLICIQSISGPRFRTRSRPRSRLLVHVGNLQREVVPQHRTRVLIRRQLLEQLAELHLVHLLLVLRHALHVAQRS